MDTDMTEAAKARREQLERDGYAILPGFFDSAEVARMQAIVSDFFRTRGVIFNLGKTQPNASMECPELAFLFGDDKVVAAFRGLLGEDDVVFTGHCDLHQDIFSRWHKDTGPRDGYFTEDCYVPDCRVYKMAVYLQDHHDGGGLTVRPGSHRERGLDGAAAVALDTRAGDAVVFDVRLTHHGRPPDAVDRLLHKFGQGVRKGFGPLVPALRRPGELPLAYHAKRAYEALIGRPRKMSIFFTYGAPNRFTGQFARANMDRQLRQYEGGGLSYPAELRRRFAEAGVRLYDGEAA